MDTKIDIRLTPREDVRVAADKNKGAEDRQKTATDRSEKWMNDKKKDGCDCPSPDSKPDRDQKHNSDHSSVSSPGILGGSFQYTDKLMRKT